MKRLILLFAVVVILIVTGGLTAQITAQGGELKIPGTIRQTNNPDASALDMTGWKAEQLFLAVGFILFNLIGIAVTIMAIFWFLNWQVKSVKAGRASQTAESSPVQTE